MYEMEHDEDERTGLRGGLKTLWQRWTDRGDEEYDREEEHDERPRGQGREDVLEITRGCSAANRAENRTTDY